MAAQARCTHPAAKIRVVWAPDELTESLRDLARAYYDALGVSKRPKLQTSGFLLRHGHVWNERTKVGGLRKTWTAGYMRWLRSIELSDRREGETFDFYVKTATEDIERCRRLARRCREEAESPEVKPYVDALCRLKGVDAIGALTYIASIGDFSRFRGGRAVSSYLGLTTRRSDSGPKRLKHGRITKAGDTTCRRALVEAMAGVSRFDPGPNLRALRRARQERQGGQRRQGGSHERAGPGHVGNRGDRQVLGRRQVGARRETISASRIRQRASGSSRRRYAHQGRHSWRVRC